MLIDAVRYLLLLLPETIEFPSTQVLSAFLDQKFEITIRMFCGLVSTKIEVHFGHIHTHGARQKNFGTAFPVEKMRSERKHRRPSLTRVARLRHPTKLLFCPDVRNSVPIAATGLFIASRACADDPSEIRDANAASNPMAGPTP